MNVPGDPKATDPFLLLMEDWFPRGVFDRQQSGRSMTSDPAGWRRHPVHRPSLSFQPAAIGSERTFAVSRIARRSHRWAASVFMRGCQAIRYLNLPSTSGGLSIFIAGLFDSNPARRLGTVASNGVPATHRMAAVK